MSRLPVENTIGGLLVTCTPLLFPQAQPLLPEVGAIVSLAISKFGQLLETEKSLKTVDVLRLAPLIGELSEHLGSGRLERLAPKILATTTVVTENVAGEAQVFELGKDKDRSYVFDEHPEIFFQVLIFAGMVTFKRFFPATGRSAGSAP